jgi:hypothetical protein
MDKYLRTQQVEERQLQSLARKALPAKPPGRRSRRSAVRH